MFLRKELPMRDKLSARIPGLLLSAIGGVVIACIMTECFAECVDCTGCFGQGDECCAEVDCGGKWEMGTYNGFWIDQPCCYGCYYATGTMWLITRSDAQLATGSGYICTETEDSTCEVYNCDSTPACSGTECVINFSKDCGEAEDGSCTNKTDPIDMPLNLCEFNE